MADKQGQLEKQTIDTLVGVLDKRMNRQLKQYMDICVRCAICRRR